MEKNKINKQGISPIHDAKIEEVICITTTIGDGQKSPIVAVKQYWTKSGKFIGEIKS